MYKSLTITLIVFAVAVALPGTTGAREYWVPAAAHTVGVANTVWRTDVAVLNLCSITATVELRLRHDHRHRR